MSIHLVKSQNSYVPKDCRRDRLQAFCKFWDLLPCRVRIRSRGSKTTLYDEARSVTTQITKTHMKKILFLAILLAMPILVQGKAKPLPFEKYPIVIWCHNPGTREVKKPINKSPQDWACYYGKWWKNILIPSLSQYKDLKTVFKTEWGMLTAMTLISHESQWDSKAKWCSPNGCDYGLLQIRWVNGWAKMNDKQQMEWFKKRKEWQMSPKWNCYQRFLQGNKEKLLRCVFARHHGDLLWTAPYPTERYREWIYINDYFKEYDF